MTSLLKNITYFILLFYLDIWILRPFIKIFKVREDRPRDLIIDKEIKMATAMYLEHYLDSKWFAFLQTLIWCQMRGERWLAHWRTYCINFMSWLPRLIKKIIFLQRFFQRAKIIFLNFVIGWYYALLPAVCYTVKRNLSNLIHLEHCDQLLTGWIIDHLRLK